MTDKYSEPLVNYNLNGNITTYQRRGQTTSNTFDLIDNLVYFYDANIPDRLIRVVDLAPTANRPYGFKPKGTTFYYGYDNAGNMTSDGHKDLTIAYNALNLPDVFTFANVTPNNKIEIVYNAAGEKLEKQVYTGATLSTHKRYVMGIEYTGANLEAIYHAEGRIVPIGGGVFRYEYTLKDHLGNSRVSFAANGSSIQLLQENHYYPFGMEMKGAWIAQSGTENGYQYNGKELNEDWGLNWSDYGKRWYDATIGRWNGIDLSAEKYLSFSPYHFSANDPVNVLEIDGADWIINRKKNKDGGWDYTITINAVVFNSTGDKNLDMGYIASNIQKQVESIYSTENMDVNKGENKNTVSMTMNIKAIDKLEEAKETDHLIVIMGDKAFKSHADKNGGKKYFDPHAMADHFGLKIIISKKIACLDDEKYKRTVSHELLHTAGMRHPEDEYSSIVQGLNKYDSRAKTNLAGSNNQLDHNRLFIDQYDYLYQKRGKMNRPTQFRTEGGKRQINWKAYQ
jgi:RHS repeat-associated protein